MQRKSSAHTRDRRSWNRRDHASSVHSQRVPRYLRGAISAGCNTCVSGDRLRSIQA